MRVVVHDASILIDLALSETVEAWFSTRIETWTTELIYPREIQRPEQRELFQAQAAAGELRIRTFSPSELENLVSARARFGVGLSLADVSALFLARELGGAAVLATGDRLLRSTAERNGLKACGILRLFDLMTGSLPGRSPSLTPAAAIEKLRRSMALPGWRLPRAKCEEKIREWAAKAGG